MPSGGQIRWSVPPGEAGNYILAGGGRTQFGERAEITGLIPGLTEIDVQVSDTSGVVLESQKYPLCIPQFINITENAAEFDVILNELSVSHLKEEILRESKRVVDLLFTTSNVRIC